MAFLVLFAAGGLCARAYHGFRVLTEEARLLESVDVSEAPPPVVGDTIVFKGKLTEESSTVEFETRQLMRPSLQWDRWNSLLPKTSVGLSSSRTLSLSGHALAELPSVVDMEHMDRGLVLVGVSSEGPVRVTRKRIDSNVTLYCCGKWGNNGELQPSPERCPFYLMTKHSRDVASDLRKKAELNRAEAILWAGIAGVTTILSFYSSGD